MPGPVVCIGGSLVDELFYMEGEILPATTNFVSVSKTAGGVSRNIAHQLALLNVPVELISVFGNDGDGVWLKEVSTKAGVSLDASLTIDRSSGKYTAIIEKNGTLFTGFLTNHLTQVLAPEHLEERKDLLKTASWIIADTNVSAGTLQWLLTFSKQAGVPLIIEPVAVPPALKLKTIELDGLYLITPNEDELPAICSEKAFTREDQVNELFQRGVRFIWLHNGKAGSTLYSNNRVITLAAVPVEVVDSNGAGDAALAGYIMGKYLGMEDIDCLKLAHTLSSQVLQVKGAVAKDLDQIKLLSLLSKFYPANE